MNPEDYEPQTKTVKVDIPTKGKKVPKKVVLSPEVKAERNNVRRYLRPDGIFAKGLEHFFDVPELDESGAVKRDQGGNVRRQPTKTAEEAEEFVVDLCKKAGRKIETDPMTKRLKAVPGWNFDIRVPGMNNEELFAPKKAKAEDQQTINEAMLAKVLKDNEILARKVAELTGKKTKKKVK